MPIRNPSPPSRKPRADAQRNRERILDIARQLFTSEGASVSLEDITRTAGVGPGTLYRHFPTREALIEAVFQSEVEKLAAAEQHFAQTLPPLEALRAWMLHFITYVENKLLILPALDSIPGGSTRLMEGSRNLVHTAFLTAIQRAIDSGDLDPNTDPQDLMRALIGIFHTTALPGWEASARRLVDILLAGSRPQHPAKP